MAKKDRSLFWSEPERLTRLASELVLGEGVGRAPTAHPDENSPGAEEPTAHCRTAESAPETKVPTFEVPEETGEVRLRAFLNWLTDSFGVRKAFVADAHGLSLVDESSSPELVAAASMVGSGWKSVHEGLGLPGAEAFIVSLGGGEWLHLLVQASRFDRLSVGFLAGDPLPSIQLDAMRAAFESCLQEQDSEPGT